MTSLEQHRSLSSCGGGMLVIKASAGSGKTYTLAQLYIELLLLKPGPGGRLVLRQTRDYHRRILAITFTNKATDEMKRRIVAELYQLATDVTKSDYRDHFQTLCTPEAFAGLQDAARRALTAVLMNYSAFCVSTIDSFFQSIMRNFARELDRDYNYEVQVDGDYAVRTAVHNFLLALGNDHRRAGMGTTVEQWVREFIRDSVSLSENWNFFASEELFKLANRVNDELFQAEMPRIRDYLSTTDSDGTTRSDLSRISRFKRSVAAARDHYRRVYIEEFAGAMADILARNRIDVRDLSKSKPLNTFLLAGKMAEGGVPTDALRRITTHETAAACFLKDAQDRLTDALLGECVLLATRVVETYDRWQLLDAMARKVGLLGLLGEIDLKLEEYRKENNVVLIADTNELINRLVQGPGAVPFIYERVGTQIDHYMIDEFQDTSHKQYDNFRPLLEESLSHNYGGDNFNMVIGDAKQSIYRFRNADPALFRESVNADFAAHLRQGHLPTNYRSLATVVTFNNLLFDRLVESYTRVGGPLGEAVHRTYAPTGPDDYRQQIHKSGDRYPQGYVRLITSSPATGDDEDGGEPKPYKAVNGSMRTESRDAILGELPPYLHDLHRRYDWGQIGILVNTGREGAAVVNAILEHNKQHADEPGRLIAVTSDESLLLRNSPTVRRLVSLLRFVDMVQYHPDDEQALESLAADVASMSPADKRRRRLLKEQRKRQVLSEFIAATTAHPDMPAGHLLDRCIAGHDERVRGRVEEQMLAYEQELTRLLPDPRTHPLTLTGIVERLIEHICRDGDSHTETAFLLAFQSCVNDYATRTSGGTVREFLRFWEQNKDKLSVPSAAGADAVTVMTIHKSKGLEFDCVLIPFAAWLMDNNTREQEVWVTDRQWQADGGSELLTDAGVTLDDADLPPLLPLPKSLAEQLAGHCHALSDIVRRHSADTLIDNLDKTYVALTRPKMEMHIFAAGAKTKEKEGVTALDDPSGMCVGQVLADVVPHLAGVHPWQKRGWQLGEPVPRQERRRGGEVLTAPMPSYYVTPSPGKVTVRLPHDTTASQDAGTRLHNVMSRIRYARDVSKALDWGERRGVFDGKWTRADFKQMLDGLLADHTTAPWFADDNTVYNERSIVALPGGGACRPDRVVRRPDGTIVVVDYKFGEIRDEYAVQVSRYMELYHSLGHEQVRGYLLLLEPGVTPQVIEV